MYRSLQKPQSPARQAVSFVRQEQDSPSRQRIQLLSEKWNSIQTGIDKDKNEKKEILDEKIKILEDQFAVSKPLDEQKFKVDFLSLFFPNKQILRDQTVKLLEQTQLDTEERVAFDEKRNKDLLTLTENSQNAIQSERIQRNNNETKQQKQLDEKFSSINLTLNRQLQSYDDRFQQKRNDTRSQIQAIKSQLDQARREREESASGLQDALDSELRKFQDQLLVEKKVREETQSKIFRMIEDIHGRLQQDLAIEKRERESTTDALLKLLEDACIKIDKNIRY